MKYIKEINFNDFDIEEHSTCNNLFIDFLKDDIPDKYKNYGDDKVMCLIYYNDFDDFVRMVSKCYNLHLSDKLKRFKSYYINGRYNRLLIFFNKKGKNTFDITYSDNISGYLRGLHNDNDYRYDYYFDFVDKEFKNNT